MAQSQSKVQLYGFWASPFVYRVIWALKSKGVEYEYIEEELFKNSSTSKEFYKTSALLEYNPVYKKVPVLVHDGRPVAESTVILQYIEEMWPGDDGRSSLLPEDAHERAVARFWLDFVDQKILTFGAFFLSSNENKEKTAEQVMEILKTIQDHALGEKKFFGGNKIGLVDLMYGWLTFWFDAMQELVGIKILEPNTLPRLYQWSMNFRQEPVIKENVCEYKALLEHLKMVRERSRHTETSS